MSRFFHLQKVNRERIKTLWKAERKIRFLLLLTFLVWLLIPVLSFVYLRPGAEEGQYLPLHYNIFFGVDKYGPWYSVFQLPAFGLFVLLLNIYLAAKFFERERILSLFIVCSTLAVQITLLAAVYFIILLNL